MGPGSETFARPPPFNKFEFEVRNPDFTLSNIEGIPDSQVKTVLNDLVKMMPQDVRKLIDSEQTRSDRGPWPRKIMVSLWFKHDTGLTMLIEIMKMVIEELDKAKFCVNGQRVRTNLEMCPQKNPSGRVHAMFFTGLKEARGDETNITFMGTFRYRSLRELDRKDKGSWQPKTRARAKVTRMKAGKPTRKWCPRLVQNLTTYFLKRL